MAINSELIEQCDRIAFIAHTARGQKRADKITPYIVHPRRVAQLLQHWSPFDPHLFKGELSYAMAAGLLHDVLEDTKLTREDLLLLRVPPRVVELVLLLTKPGNPSDPAPLQYYEAIAHDPTALRIKCADRCANLEDAASELHEGRKPTRWRNYIVKTYVDVLPLYRDLPFFRSKLLTRLAVIEATLEVVAPELNEDIGALVSRQSLMRSVQTPSLRSSDKAGKGA